MDQLGCNLFLRIFALGSIEINVGKWSIKAAVEVAQEADALNLPFLLILPTLITIIAIIAIFDIITIVAIAIIITNIASANMVTTVAAANIVTIVITNVTRRR